MVAFLLPVAIFLLTICQDGQAATWNRNLSSLDTARWLCEHHSHALESKFEVTPDRDNATRKYYCQLYFDYDVPEEEWATVCNYMYPAHLETVEKSTRIGLFSCRYEILYLCHPGKLPLHYMCIEFREQKKTFQEAEEDCEQSDGRLPYKIEGDSFVNHILMSLNPRLLGISGRRFWIGGEPTPSIVTMARGSDLVRPGQQIRRKDKSQKADYFCISTAMKQPAMLEKECNIYRNSFKLTALFYEGTCYMLSPSLSVAPIVRNAPDVRQLHERCRWFSREDRAVTPMSPPRREAIDTLLKGTRYEYTHVMTTTLKVVEKGQDEKDGWVVQNHVQLASGWTNTPIYPGARVWPEGRPVLDDSESGQNLQAVVLPRPLRTKGGLLLDMPSTFRSHLVCATGITLADFDYLHCDKGWDGIYRDEGRVMCVRAFTTELHSKDYDTAMRFCAQFGAVLAPAESADEQEIIIRQIGDLKPEVGAMWLGARRREPDGPFYWELNQKPVAVGTGTNWAGDEPNNVEGKEACMQIYASGEKINLWNDIACDTTHRWRRDDTIVGGVCAKYLN